MHEHWIDEHGDSGQISIPLLEIVDIIVPNATEKISAVLSILKEVRYMVRQDDRGMAIDIRNCLDKFSRYLDIIFKE